MLAMSTGRARALPSRQLLGAVATSLVGFQVSTTGRFWASTEAIPGLQGLRVRAAAALSHRRVQSLRPALSLTNHQGPRDTDPPGPRRGGARDQLHVQRAAPDDRSVSR